MGIVGRLPGKITSLGRAVIARPLNRGEVAAATFILFVGGTIYCAIYCRIAFYPMHAGGMPLWLSAWWAATSLLPWLAAFELVKRLPAQVSPTWVRMVVSLGIAVLAAALTITAYWLTDIEMMKMSATNWPRLLASQLQPAVVFALVVSLRAAYRRDGATANTDSHSDVLPALGQIDWIRAAGNYVELKCGDRLLIRRMTMRSAEAATQSADFVRIHRSLIVRKPLIRGFAGTGRSRVLLATGETLPVGDSYRPAVERLVPSSQDSSLRTIPV
jgi:DNA-binding LytR/AlgR family response regulator